MFIGVRGTSHLSGTSMYNLDEAKAIVGLLAHMISKHRVKPERVQFITPYRAQCSVISKMAKKYLPNVNKQVSTIDAVQGKEFDFVFVSMVVSDKNS